jgi:hypothetical protein
VHKKASQCLFCGNKAGSREHLWPAWIHKRLQITAPIRIAIGKKPVQISGNPEIKVKTACGTCNNGWMSTLEGQCVPLIGSLMQDISTPLGDSQQSLLTAWALKTAMVTDSTNKITRNLFYEKSEREKLRAVGIEPGTHGSFLCSEIPTADRVREFGSVQKPDVDVERSLLELVLDPIHDLAANPGVLLSTHDFLQMSSSKAGARFKMPRHTSYWFEDCSRETSRTLEHRHCKFNDLRRPGTNPFRTTAAFHSLEAIECTSCSLWSLLTRGE